MIAKNKRPAKFTTQAYTRCEKCGRPHSVYIYKYTSILIYLYIKSRIISYFFIESESCFFILSSSFCSSGVVSFTYADLYLWSGILFPLTALTFPFVLRYLVLSSSGCFVSPLSR